MIEVSVIGATGYAGIELVRLLSSHPNVKLINLISHSHGGKKLQDIYPQFSLHKKIILGSLDIEKITDESHLVFTSLPHGASSKIIPKLYKKGLRIIDLSGCLLYTSRCV